VKHEVKLNRYEMSIIARWWCGVDVHGQKGRKKRA